MINYLSNIQINLYVAFLLIGFFSGASVTCLVIGYVLGRNSAEKPLMAEKKPKPPKLRDDEIVTPMGDGDIIMDEIEDLENEAPYAGRIATM